MKRRSFILIGLVFSVSLFLLANITYASPITQGEYAVQLAEALGLGEDLSVDEAIAALENVEIVPEEGWQPEEEVSTDFLEEIFELIMEVARRGLIPFSQDEAYNIFISLNEQLGLGGLFTPPPLAAPAPLEPPPPPPVPPGSPSE